MGIKYQINRDFFKVWTPQMAYVLGFISADGSLEDASYLRGKYLRICSSDVEIIEKIRTTMNSAHKIVTIKPKDFLFRGKKYIPKEKYMLRIGSHEIYNDLIKLGITPHKSKTIQFPDVPTESLSYFIRGYLDGDGCINLYNRKKRLSVTFTSGSENFLWRLSEVISSALGIKRHNVFNNHWAFQVKYSTKEAVPLLKYCYSDTGDGLYLERKYNKFLDFFRLYPKWQEYNGAMAEQLSGGLQNRFRPVQLRFAPLR
jgi:hypothetical protein